MKYLTIIRHAKSSWDYPDLDDILRPLNERGKNAVILVGNYLRQQNIKPDLIISSPATRARDTASGIGEILNYNLKELQIEPVVYFGASSAIVDTLRKLDNKYQDVFLVGHEPILTSLIFLFRKISLEKFPTCAVFRVSFDTKEWKNIKNGAQKLFITPKQLLV